MLADMDELNEELGCNSVVPTVDWPSVPSLTANTVSELVSKLPNHLVGPILVDTAQSAETWENMIGETDGIDCSVVWHDGKMFIVELQSVAHQVAVYSFAKACDAIVSQLAPGQTLTNCLAASICIHPPAPAQPFTYKPDAQLRLGDGVPVLVLEVGWTQNWNQLLAKANNYLTLTNGKVKLVVLVKIYPGQGVPLYIPGQPQPAAAGPVSLPMQAAVASIIHGQFFVSQLVKFGVGQANHAQPRLRLPFRRLFPPAARAAVDAALGNNPFLDLTTMRTNTEDAYLQMVQTGKDYGNA